MNNRKLCCDRAFLVIGKSGPIIRHCLGCTYGIVNPLKDVPRRVFRFEVKAETGTYRWTCFEGAPLALYLNPRRPPRRIQVVRAKSIQFAGGKEFYIKRDYQAFNPFVETGLSYDELRRRQENVERGHKDLKKRKHPGAGGRPPCYDIETIQKAVNNVFFRLNQNRIRLRQERAAELAIAQYQLSNIKPPALLKYVRKDARWTKLKKDRCRARGSRKCKKSAI
ncbi:MAG: hypothetical protein WC299_06425 [Kiritimatiellia bacterium]